MRTKYTLFYLLSAYLFTSLLFIMAGFVLQYSGASTTLPGAEKIRMTSCALLVIAILFVIFMVLHRLNISTRIRKHPIANRLTELILTMVILLGAVLCRVYVLIHYPVEPLSNFKTNMDIASMILDGSLREPNNWYSGYAALFPHQLGYSWFLCGLFRIFGSSVTVVTVTNLVLSVLTALLCQATARIIAGRTAGIAALTAASFFPSQIFFISFVSPCVTEAFFLMLSIWLYVLSTKHGGWHEKRSWTPASLLILCGMALGIFGTMSLLVYPVAIAMIISSARAKWPNADIPTNDIPLGSRATAKGWQRCLFILAAAFLTFSVIRASAQYQVYDKLAGDSSSLTYDLWVGLNRDSSGMWNEEDSDYLQKLYEQTGSADEALRLTGSLVKERFTENPKGLNNLFSDKFSNQWGNDSYAVSWHRWYLEQQGADSSDLPSVYAGWDSLCTFYYFLILLLGVIAGITHLHRRPDTFYLLIAVLNLMVLWYLFFQNAGTDHYAALSLLSVAAGLSVSAIRKHAGQMTEKRTKDRETEKAREAEHKERIAFIEQQNKEIETKRAEALSVSFDLGKALQEGHVNITMTEAAAEPNEEEILKRRKEAYEKIHHRQEKVEHKVKAEHIDKAKHTDKKSEIDLKEEKSDEENS